MAFWINGANGEASLIIDDINTLDKCLFLNIITLRAKQTRWCTSVQELVGEGILRCQITEFVKLYMTKRGSHKLG